MGYLLTTPISWLTLAYPIYLNSLSNKDAYDAYFLPFFSLISIFSILKDAYSNTYPHILC